MSNELQLGKYEFFPYDDKSDVEDILEELEKSLSSDDETEKCLKELIEKSTKRKKKIKKKQPVLTGFPDRAISHAIYRVVKIAKTKKGVLTSLSKGLSQAIREAR